MSSMLSSLYNGVRNLFWGSEAPAASPSAAASGASSSPAPAAIRVSSAAAPALASSAAASSAVGSGSSSSACSIPARPQPGEGSQFANGSSASASLILVAPPAAPAASSSTALYSLSSSQVEEIDTDTARRISMMQRFIENNGFLFFYKAMPRSEPAYHDLYNITDVFGNFCNTPFTHTIMSRDGRTPLLRGRFVTREAAFHADKLIYVTDENERERIFKYLQKETDGDKALRCGRTIPGFDLTHWNTIKFERMKNLISECVAQNPKLKAMLLSTDDAYLVEHYANLGHNRAPALNDFWSDGGTSNSGGQNQLGQAWMKVRGEIGGIGEVLPPRLLPVFQKIDYNPNKYITPFSDSYSILAFGADKYLANQVVRPASAAASSSSSSAAVAASSNPHQTMCKVCGIRPPRLDLDNSPYCGRTCRDNDPNKIIRPHQAPAVFASHVPAASSSSSSASAGIPSSVASIPLCQNPNCTRGENGQKKQCHWDTARHTYSPYCSLSCRGECTGH